MKGESMTDKKMAGKNLNQKIKELDEKVAWFSSDDFELEKAVKEYEETLVLTKSRFWTKIFQKM